MLQRSNGLALFFVSFFICGILIISSATGLLSPLESLVSTPLHILSEMFTDLTQSTSGFFDDLSEIQELRDRNAELEEALAQYQSELVQLREIASDYQRLAELINYTAAFETQETIAAEVISYDPNGILRTIGINRGSRDGITRGMPVVTGQGLVGRIIDVTANASRVLLITDPSSHISARLQTSRDLGSVQGLLTGSLRMGMIPLEANVQVGDIVITSGLGGNLPPDIIIGQVTSKRQFEFELNQQAEVRSLISFDTLEFVLVVTNFQPIDISAFESSDN